MHYSPLRYPGGKAFLKSEFERILSHIELDKPVYVEPYAGGAGAALALLFADKVSSIVINDYDKAIFSFWKAATEDSERFVNKIHTVPVTIKEWNKQKRIYEKKTADTFTLGFATFFLNRTNHSGVMNAWPIGGINQTGNFKIDARFNREDLARRIRKIGEHANRITVSKKDGIVLTREYLKQPNTFIYLDPPYFEKGAMLYFRNYETKDHKSLADLLNKNADKYWVLTYDEKSAIRDLYKGRDRSRLRLSYRVRGARVASELMIFSDTTKV